MIKRVVALLLVVGFAAACPGKSNNASKSSNAADTHIDAPQLPPLTISIMGTNDLHGHLERLPLLANYVTNLRRARKSDGAVVLVDAGDMFQGTLPSNLTEGASVVDVYNAMGYAAATVGNHEFDFGPVGVKSTPQDPADDPRGALKARVQQAAFPILAANIVDAKTKRAMPWLKTHVVHNVAGVSLGIIGVTTTATPYTTIAANFKGLKMVPLAQAIIPLAQRLRREGASAIIVLAHAGGICRGEHNPSDLSGCDDKQEIFRVANKLPKGTVDVIVAGHTHAWVAHRVNGIAIIESNYKGLAFGRVDLRIDRKTKRLIRAEIKPIRFLCKQGKTKGTGCRPGRYEGKEVVADTRVAALAEKALAQARTLLEQSLGVTVAEPIRRSRAYESELGNMIADLMRIARPGADVTLTNGGGLRADLPAGPLTYGRFYEAQPFDNQFATIKLTAAEFANVLRRNLQRAEGIFSISGLVAKAMCDGATLRVQLFRNGRVLAGKTKLTLVTNDFLSSGGDGAFGMLRKRPGAIVVGNHETIRDALVKVLRKRGGTLKRRDFYDHGSKRLQFTGTRPLRCK